MKRFYVNVSNMDSDSFDSIQQFLLNIIKFKLRSGNNRIPFNNRKIQFLISIDGEYLSYSDDLNFLKNTSDLINSLPELLIEEPLNFECIKKSVYKFFNYKEVNTTQGYWKFSNSYYECSGHSALPWDLFNR